MLKIQIIDVENPLWQETLEKLRYDIYHSSGYVDLEAQRNQATPEAVLIEEGEKIFFLPYLIRRCDSLFEKSNIAGFFDVLSPYGYPGILLNDEAIKKTEFVDLAMKELIDIWRKKDICSAFLRLHPILNKDLNEICHSTKFQINGETVSVKLTLSDAEIWHDTRPEHRTKINKCKRLGFMAEICPFEDEIRNFLVIYEETMNRVGATSTYSFGEEYFTTLKRVLGDKLHLCMVKFENQWVCGGVFTECCGIIQYHLGGSKNEFLKQAPNTLMFDSMRFWGKQRGNQYFHLGGGLGGSKDSLYHFKAGFSKERHTFLTLRLIIDDEKYRYLVELCAKSLNTEPEKLLKSDFFPAYRSPKIR